jgi:hypothetical protein
MDENATSEALNGHGYRNVRAERFHSRSPLRKGMLLKNSSVIVATRRRGLEMSTLRSAIARNAPICDVFPNRVARTRQVEFVFFRGCELIDQLARLPDNLLNRRTEARVPVLIPSESRNLFSVSDLRCTQR